MLDTQPAAASGSSSPLAHLPDSSDDLAAMADLEISVGGARLPLHSAVLASGSRVLREALCCQQCYGGSGGGSTMGASQVAAVQEAFEGCNQQVVQTFLKLLYNPTVVDDIPAEASWPDVLALADKLDAPAALQVMSALRCLGLLAYPNDDMPCLHAHVKWRPSPHCCCVQACDSHLARVLPAAGTDWMKWLLLADRLQLKRLVARCASPVALHMIETSNVKAQVAALNSLSQRSLQLMMETLLRTSRTMASNSIYGGARSCVPQTSAWAALGDLF